MQGELLITTWGYFSSSAFEPKFLIHKFRIEPWSTHIDPKLFNFFKNFMFVLNLFIILFCFPKKLDESFFELLDSNRNSWSTSSEFCQNRPTLILNGCSMPNHPQIDLEKSGHDPVPFYRYFSTWPRSYKKFLKIINDPIFVKGRILRQILGAVFPKKV